MNDERHSSAGRAPKIGTVYVVALYDPHNGDILHAHAVTAAEGRPAVSEQDVIEEAKALAKKAGHAIEGLKVKTSSELRHALTPHRVDLQTQEFVAVEMRKRIRTLADSEG